MTFCKYLLCALTFVLYSSALGPAPAKAQIKLLDPPSGLSKFQITSTPNTIDAPGVIFSFDDAGIRREYERLNNQNIPVTQLSNYPKITLKAEMTVVDLQRFLTADAQAVSPADDLKDTPTGRITIEMRIERVERQGLPANLGAILESLTIVKDWKGPNKYFLISETLRASSVSYKLKKNDATRLSDWLVRLSKQHPNVSFNRNKDFQIVQKFNTPQYIALKLDRLTPRLSSLTGVPIGTAITAVTEDMSWSVALEQLAWPPPGWSARVELPLNLWKKGNATLGSAFDVIQAAFNRAGISDRWVYRIGENGFAVVGRQESIDDLGNPLSGSERWTDDPCYNFWNLVGCVVGGAKMHRRTTVVLVTDWTFTNQSGTSPDVLKQDSGRSSLPQEMRDQPVPSGASGQALIYHFVKKNQTRPEFVPQNKETMQGRDHLIRAGFWKGEDLR